MFKRISTLLAMVLALLMAVGVAQAIVSLVDINNIPHLNDPAFAGERRIGHV